jgi:hypothetical protein
MKKNQGAGSLSENRILRLAALKEAEADGKCTDARHPSLFEPSGANTE